MPLLLKSITPPIRAVHAFVASTVFLFLCSAPAFSQKAPPDAGTLPKYDLHTEVKAKGTIDEINRLPWGAKMDITELVVKNGDDKLHIYVCPKAFQEELGITFTKGDEVALTGSKVKQEAAEVILVRELVKGSDSLVFRDDKGNPVWNSHTGK